MLQPHDLARAESGAGTTATASSATPADAAPRQGCAGGGYHTSRRSVRVTHHHPRKLWHGGDGHHAIALQRRRDGHGWHDGHVTPLDLDGSGCMMGQGVDVCRDGGRGASAATVL